MSGGVHSAKADAAPWLRRLVGAFVVFDGPDGSGKSTQLKVFAAAAREAGLTIHEAPDPGGTPVGDRIRAILLDPIHAEMVVRTEAMLYMASRAQLVEQVIRPALGRGELVLGDRFVSSTLAYQGAAGGLAAEEILAIARVACGDVWPHLTVIFDADERTAAKRLSPLLDRMEQKGVEFHRRVRAGFLAQAKADPARHVIVDASGEQAEVTNRLMLAVRRWAESRG